MIYKHSLLIVAAFMISSCSVFSPVKLPQQSTYVLNRSADNVVKRTSRPITIVVSAPETQPVYNTTQMAYSIRPYQVAYYGQNQWGETPAQMLQPLMVQSLQNTHFFRAVVTPPFLGRYDYMLSTQIIDFKQNFTRSPAVFQLTMSVQLIRSMTNQIVGVKQFVVTVPMTQKSPYGGVIAANIAAQRMLKQIADFTVTSIEK